ncbi:MAG: metallophosphoesterase [Planctomycetes bacterium]|nr:metallophosphoesterase [Planctomycetota bacterium]
MKTRNPALFLSLLLVGVPLRPAALFGADPPPEAVGLWEFDDAQDLARATAGQDLIPAGAPAPIEGVIDGDGAARIGIGSYYRCAHGIAPNGFGSRVNRYAFIIDFRVPVIGPWYTFFQIDPANRNDGETFVRTDGAIGVGDVGYSTVHIAAGIWYRLGIAVDLSSGLYSIYLDGERIVDGLPQSLDGRFSLDSTVLLFADENGEDGPIDVSLVAVFDRPLTEDEMRTLGGAGPWDPANRPPDVIVQPAGPSDARTQESYEFTFRAADPDGDRVRIRADWGDGTVSAWSDLEEAGEPLLISHAYNRTGDLAILAQARDEHGRSSFWTQVQGIVVTGDVVVRFLTEPYFQNVRTDGIAVMWELDAYVTAEAEYGPGDGYGLRAACEIADSGSGSWIYRASLDGLAPGTVHRVRPVIEGKPGEGRTFRTAPAGDEPFSFAVWGDSQGTNHGAFAGDPYEPTKAMMADMAAQGIDFAVGVGDLAEDGASYADVRAYYLDRVAVNLGPAAPWFIAWGNHDGGRSAVLRRFADHPSRDRPGYDAGWGSYSFDYAGCHFVCIDYDTARIDISTWLEDDLRAAIARDVRFTFVFVHVPPYCELWIDGDGWLRAWLVPLLVRYGVDICFSGHTHEYERGTLDGTTYVITGGGSWLDRPEGLVHDWPHMIAGGYHSLGLGIDKGLVNEYVKIDVDGDAATVRAFGFEPDGTPMGPVDAFTVHRCGNGNGPADDGDGNGIADGCEFNRRMPGDCDGDGEVGLDDALCLLGYLFLRTPAALPCGDGTRSDPANVRLLSGNGDGRVDIADAIHLVRHLFGEGPPHVLGGSCVEIEGCPAACGLTSRAPDPPRSAPPPAPRASAASRG